MPKLRIVVCTRIANTLCNSFGSFICLYNCNIYVKENKCQSYVLLYVHVLQTRYVTVLDHLYVYINI